MAKKQIYHAAVYVRLSKEDGDVVDARKAESDSISNQKSLITSFLKTKEDIKVVSVHEDDGYTGSNFDRPGFRRMMDEIESGKVDCVIVKDLSRFGREYISSGNYIERVFPALGVRFIAINDNVDTIDTTNPANEIVIPFKNLVNDAFCMDTSVKIRSQLDAKRRAGEYVGNYCPYGYRKADNDHNKLVPDTLAAGVVIDIFRWIREGMSLDAISRKLNNSGVKSPMEYKLDRGIRYSCNFKKHEKAKWSAVAVRRIATNPVYKGTLLQGKVSTPNHKVKKRITRDQEDMICVEGTHKGIISETEFDTVQRLLSIDMRTAPGQGRVYPLSGLCRCADCGSLMTRKSVTRKGRRYAYYMCSDNKRFGSCSSHRIREDRLQAAITETLKSVIQDTVSAGDIAVRLQSVNLPDREKEIAKRLQENDTETERCDRMLATLYEDFRSGIVDEKDFAVIKKNLSKKREEVRLAAKEIQSLGKEDKERRKRLEHIAEEFAKYEKIETFARSALVSLVREAKVFEGGKVEVILNCDDEFLRAISPMERQVV